jgi:TetR/AcrR family transcriptional repressor of lmrAB and yxaGH operons
VPRRSDARVRAVSTTSRLLQEQGYARTGVSQILTESGAPKGSFYFHFPGGKEQLAVEALRASGSAVVDVLKRLAETSASPAELVDSFIGAEATMLEESGFRQGCPIATVALEMSAESESIRTVCREIFDSWIRVFRRHFEPYLGSGSSDLAEHTVLSLEGALLLSRVQRSTRPLLRVRDRLCAELDTASRPDPG